MTQARAPELRAQTYVRFCASVGLALTVGQLAFATVAFDAVHIAAIAVELIATVRQLFGGIDTVPEIARQVSVVVKGRDAGFSRLGGTRALHLGLTHPLTRLDRGEAAFVFFIAPKLRLARIPMRFALAAARRLPELEIISEHADGFTVERGDGRHVIFECIAAGRGGDTARGVPILFAMLDEAAFFKDEATGVVNDKHVFNAIVPRLMAGGQILVASSPWAEVGLLYEEFKRNHGAPRTALAALCPTLVMRDDPETHATVNRERERDPENALREFDAEFMAAGADVFFDPNAIERSVSKELVLPFPRQEFAAVSAGADFGFRSDSSALVIVQREGTGLVVSQVLELKPEKGAPLVPSEVVAKFAAELKAFDLTIAMADSHYRESIAEHMRAHSLSLWPAPEGATGKAETYTRIRTLLHEGRLRLPNHPQLIRQMREVIGKPTAGGGTSISSPRWQRGGHGDLVSALVLAVYSALFAREPKASPKHAPGSVEAINAEMAEHKARVVRDLKRKQQREFRKNPRAFMRRAMEGR